MNGVVKIENIKELLVEIREQNVLLDSDVAQIYGVETRDINKAVANNPDKFPVGYIIKLTRPEKNELVENFHRFDKRKARDGKSQSLFRKRLVYARDYPQKSTSNTGDDIHH
ncbi:MAG TPA: ORF6N domain-containing protein [Gallionella sp.]|jgi:hypothetical protein|nr:ORF6N domain-containing protein [Gallionella sp.]